MNTLNFLSLPKDVHVLVASGLNDRDWSTYRLLCKRTHAISKDTLFSKQNESILALKNLLSGTFSVGNGNNLFMNHSEASDCNFDCGGYQVSLHFSESSQDDKTRALRNNGVRKLKTESPSFALLLYHIIIPKGSSLKIYDLKTLKLKKVIRLKNEAFISKIKNCFLNINYIETISTTNRFEVCVRIRNKEILILDFLNPPSDTKIPVL